MTHTFFGSLVSVNAGKPQPMTVQGETIITGFDKKPADGAIRVEAGGLVTDAHVDDADDPERALLLYPRSYYDRWDEELGRTLPHGIFGENLTFDGPEDGSVMFGDELRIGEVRLRVTQPRIPCRKMGVQLGEEDFPTRYLRSGRSGFFCEVLEPGQVQAGDKIELVRRGEGGVSVADLVRILHLQEPDMEDLGRVLACPGLPAVLRTKAERALRRAQGGGVWSGDRELVVTARHEETAQVVRLDLCAPDGERLPDFEAGQFLTLSLDVPGVDRPVVRTYTLVGRSTDGLGYRIAVKREPAASPEVPAGVASGHLHTQVVGARLRARAPRGRFVVEPGDRPVVLISAGIGITPMLAMLEQLAEREPHRPVLFAHGARSSRELAFGIQVRRTVALGAQLRSHVMFSRPGVQDVAGQDFDAAGRLTPAALEALLPSLEADFYLCGPVDFMADMVTGLIERGVPEERVHYEFFGAARPLLGGTEDGQAGPVAVDADGRPIVVTFARSGLSVPWRENTFSLLALAEQAGLRPDASCRTGLCGTCVSRIDDGEVEYAIEPMDGDRPGQVTVCCARPATSVMIDL
ncbi:MOSC domain-containing protein [Streptomyces sp. NPDC048219]|uniref:MOSC domain-containing protein n=1 Tax=Streptomyces sp. NPDC048219 TaxID=3365517 RepID=UPI003717E3B6